MNAVTAMTEPPGPRGHWLLGCAPEMQADMLGFYQRVARDYGDVAKLRVMHLTFYFLNSPQYIHHVLAGNERNYRRSDFGNRLLKIAMGDNIITTDGADWLSRRKLMQPLFTRRQVDRFAELMVEQAALMLDGFAAQAAGGAPIDVDAAMKRITLSVVGRAMFNLDLGDDHNEIASHLKQGGDYFVYRYKNPMAPPLWMPTARNRAFRRSMARVADLVPRLIAERRAALAHDRAAVPDDLLTRLLEARFDDTGQGFTDAELKSEIQVMIGAGYETTALTLAWTAYLLSQNPDIAARLEQEIDDVLQGGKPGLEVVDRLTFTRMVIDESMRLYPASWGLARTSIAPDQFGAYRVPAGANIIFSPYVLHRRPDIWPDPERFDPERFAPGQQAERPACSFIPFGFGRRSCLGNHFALLEATLVLAMAVQRFRFHLVPGRAVVPEPLMTMGPRGGLPMTLQARGGLAGRSVAA
jgi:cytochrome P450